VIINFDTEKINISRCPLEDDSSYHFDFMAKFGNLRELTLVCDSFDGMDIQRFRFVKSLKKIEKLILPSRIDDEFIKDYVSSLTNLKQLSLQNSKISGAGLKYLLNLPALEKLDISNSRLNDNDIAVLAKHQALQFVYIGAPNNITKKGVNYLNAEINKRHPSDIPHVDSYGAISVRDGL